MALQPGTNTQIPNNSIMNIYGRRAYLGDQYTASSDVVTQSDTAEHPAIYIANAATNTVSLFNYLRSLNCPNPNGTVIFRVYFNPTGVTGGTPFTPVNNRSGSTFTSAATVLLAPSVSSNGTKASISTVSFGAQTIDSVMLIVDPGKSLLITCQSVGSASNYIVEATWWEE